MAVLDQAFEHAEWVGFGAKTSVGYGAMAPAQSPAVSASAAAGAPQGVAAGAAAATAQQVWARATLTLNPGTGEVKASFEGKVTTGIKGSGADQLRAALPKNQADTFKKKKELKGVAVWVEPLGNGWQLKGLAPA